MAPAKNGYVKWGHFLTIILTLVVLGGGIAGYMFIQGSDHASRISVNENQNKNAHEDRQDIKLAIEKLDGKVDQLLAQGK